VLRSADLRPADDPTQVLETLFQDARWSRVNDEHHLLRVTLRAQVRRALDNVVPTSDFDHTDWQMTDDDWDRYVARVRALHPIWDHQLQDYIARNK
jgi:hypothetical protein